MIVCEYTGFESFEQKDVYKRDMCLTANKKETPITTSRNAFLEPKTGARVRSGRFSQNIPSKSQLVSQFALLVRANLLSIHVCSITISTI